MDRLDTLNRFAFYRQVPAAVQVTLAAAAQPRSISAGADLFRQGDELLAAIARNSATRPARRAATPVGLVSLRRSRWTRPTSVDGGLDVDSLLAASSVAASARVAARSVATEASDVESRY